MAGDLKATERAMLSGTGDDPDFPHRVIHRYGRVEITVVPDDVPGSTLPRQLAPESPPKDLTETEALGLEALRLRGSSGFRAAKENRPRNGEPWDMHGCARPLPSLTAGAPGTAVRAILPETSGYLEGDIAVAIMIVQGPTPALKFTQAEILKIVAEAQNGLGFFPTTNPLAGISFTFEIKNIKLTVPAAPDEADLESRWLDPAMASLGFGPGLSGVFDYAADMRTRLGTKWAYCCFFTKYPLWHFGYAYIGGPAIIMDPANDGWGEDNIDRVLAHETGHIFGAPDEYASSLCDCEGTWGRYGVVNGNCENCAAFGGVDCLMKINDFVLCNFTPAHLGWSPQLVLRNFGSEAGNWSVRRHLRLMADTTGDGRADIVGFGSPGVYVSRARADGSFPAPTLVSSGFGYADGWRLEKHPRTMTDTTGNGRTDIVGFGAKGVWVALARPDGTYEPARLVRRGFGYSTGWRVEKHPRFMADTTGDGRTDIVGFGNPGVYVSRAQADGSYAAPKLVLKDFGYVAGGWRIDKHPRTMADTTGDGRADIVGFGYSGVSVALARANGSYAAARQVVRGYGYATGWRVDKHLRMMADLTGDGRTDIIGFGTEGVYVSRALPGGSYTQPRLALKEFGYAQGWRVDKHPRLLADTTGDGLLDIVGFGNTGVHVARGLGDGTFDAPARLDVHFGNDAAAGGWTPQLKPRTVADATGNGRADIVGFGAQGVYVARH